MNIPVMVSVIVPYYNNEKTLGAAIKSVLQQNYGNFELILIDDCSSDSSGKIAFSESEFDNRIICLRTPENGGVSAARNMGLRMASGVWLAVLDADDQWAPERLQNLLVAADQTNADLIIDNLLLVDHETHAVFGRTYYNRFKRNREITAMTVVDNDSPVFGWQSIGYCKPFFKRQLIVDHGLEYDLNYRRTQDYLFLFAFLMASTKAIAIDYCGYLYTLHTSPTSRNYSPSSSVNDATDYIVKGCEKILKEYESVLTNQQRQKISRRKSFFMSANVAHSQRQLWHSGRIFTSLKLFILHRDLLLLTVAKFRFKLFMAGIGIFERFHSLWK